MYTNQKLSEIISTLENLSKMELVNLKNIIDYLISKKSAEDRSFVSLMNTEQNDARSESVQVVVIESGVIKSGLIENPDDIYKAIPNLPGVPKIGGASIRGSVKTIKIADVSEIKVEIKKPIFTPKSRRPSGFWKGKVSMPDNFNDLSSDIVSDFGMD